MESIPIHFLNYIHLPLIELQNQNPLVQRLAVLERQVDKYHRNSVQKMTRYLVLIVQRNKFPKDINTF